MVHLLLLIVVLISKKAMVRGKYQNAGFVLATFRPLWRRINYLFNSSVWRNYHHITTATSQFSLWNSPERIIVVTRMLVYQFIYYCWLGHTNKCLCSKLVSLGNTMNFIGSFYNHLKKNILGKQWFQKPILTTTERKDNICWLILEETGMLVG